MWCSSFWAYYPQRASISHFKHSCLPPTVWISEESLTIQQPEHKALCQTALLLWRWRFRKIGHRKPSSACEKCSHTAAQCWAKDGGRVSGSLRPGLSSCTSNYEQCSRVHCRQTVSTLRRHTSYLFWIIGYKYQLMEAWLLHRILIIQWLHVLCFNILLQLNCGSYTTLRRLTSYLMCFGLLVTWPLLQGLITYMLNYDLIIQWLHVLCLLMF